jgi:plasmid stabilization system protein ParE
MQTFKRPQFLLDLAGELSWLKENAGAAVAGRWYENLLETIADLERHPFLGRRRPDLNGQGIRSWRVNRYPRWLIFYSVEENGDLILFRVKYGMMDLPGIFQKE